MKSISRAFGQAIARGWLLLLCLGRYASPVLAADGHMGIVTGNPGKIMAGPKVLAEVPRGTRLWVFSEKPGWAEVKLPNKEEHGWMNAATISKSQLSAQQTATLSQAMSSFYDFEVQYKKDEYPQAKASLEKCLQLELSVYGTDHPEVASSKLSLGHIALAQLDPKTASRHYEESLRISRLVLGNNHQDVALALNNLGLAAEAAGNHAQAIKYHQESLEIYRGLNAGTQVAAVLSDLGDALHSNGDLPQARKVYEEALASKGKVPAEEALLVDNSSLHYKLGRVASEQRDHPAAEKYLKQALAYYRNNVFGDPARSADTLDELGVDAARQRKFPEARKYYDEALGVLKKEMLQPDLNVLASVYSHLADLEIEQKNNRAAHARLVEALECYDKLFMVETSRAEVLQKLGRVSIELADFPAARKHYELALKIRRAELGNDHADTQETVGGLKMLSLLEAPGISRRDPPPVPERKLTDLEMEKLLIPELPKLVETAPIKPPALPPGSGKPTFKVPGPLTPLPQAQATQAQATQAQATQAPAVPAVKSYMGIVTANPGKIMDGEKVLAEVPQGTRLWVFNTKAGSVEVKVPGKEIHGRLQERSIEPIKRTAQQEEENSQAIKFLKNAVQLKQANRVAEARLETERGLAIARLVLGEHPQVAFVLNHLSGLARNQGDFPAARKYNEEALAIQRKYLGNEHPETANSLDNLGVLATDQGDYPAARKYLEESLAIQRKVLGNEHLDTASSLDSLAGLFNQQSNYAAARKLYEESLAIRRKVVGNNHPDTANSLNNLGLLAHNTGDYPAARKFYDEALAIKRKLFGNEDTQTATTLSNMGELARNLSDYPTAKKFHEEALGIFRKVLGSEHPITSISLNNLGAVANDQGDYPTARKCYEESLAIRRKALGNDHPDTATSHNNLGTLAHTQGDYPTAQKHYSETLSIYRKILGNEHPNTAISLNNLGKLSSNQGDYQNARKYYAEALAIRRKVLGNEHPETATSLNDLGELSSIQGDYPTARKLFDESLAIQRKVLGNLHPDTAITLNSLSILAFKQNDYSTARKLLAESLDIQRKVLRNDHPDTSGLLNNLGLIADKQGDFPSARKFTDESRRSTSRHVRRTLPALSEPEQIQFLNNVYLWNWTTSLSFGWAQRADLESATASAGWLVNGKAVAQEALAARALLTRDAENPQTAPLVRDLKATRRQLAALSMSTPDPKQAADRQTQLTELTAQEERLARALSQATGSTGAVQEWVELDEVRKHIPADAIYVDLVRMGLFDHKSKKSSRPHYLAWIIPPDAAAKIEILDLGEAAEIETALEKARAVSTNAADKDSLLRKEGEVVANAQATKDLQTAADLVLKPLLPHLKDKKQLILSPDGALWLLPWVALPIGENKCLLEQCSIRYVLSGRDLVKKESARKLAPGAAAIFVNPDYDLVGQAAKAAIRAVLPQTKFDETETRSFTSRSSLPRVTPLPFTSLEGQAAALLFKQMTKSEPQSYEQEKALEAVVKNLQRPKHLLLSTHGFFLPDQERKEADDKQLLASSDSRSLPALTKDGQTLENPLLRCGLLFAGCNAPRTPGLDDGILTGMEIVGMDLRGTELVVLSACETGIGKVRNGEGVAGLRQAFQLAGARSVVSTLWQVPDRDSALIMQDLFTNLAAGQTKADALRHAQLKRIAARKEKSGAAHPFFWAAWTVTGE